MHTFEGDSCIFFFDAGLTGDLIIQKKGNDFELRIEAEDVLKLVAYEYVLSNKIRELEQMDYKKLLGEFE